MKRPYSARRHSANEVISANPGKKISAEKVDARDSAACSAFAEKIVERAGKIDLLVNNAGVIRDNLLA
ncbi:MAG: SDR family NAD(P)-dependent oxidoreductase, partial [Terriglobia bacterium]